MTQVVSFDLDSLNLDYVTDAVSIPQTPEDQPASLVRITSDAITSNPKYAAMFIIEDPQGNEGIVLVQNKLAHMIDLYEQAKEKNDEVPVVVFGDEGGVAWPFTNQDLRKWKERNL